MSQEGETRPQVAVRKINLHIWENLRTFAVEYKTQIPSNIKKSILFLSALICFGFIAHAQYTTVVTDDIESIFPDSPNNGKVRNWTGTGFSLIYSYGERNVFHAVITSDYIGGVVSPSFPVYEVEVPSPIAGTMNPSVPVISGTLSVSCKSY